jgi:hypothetical protein
MKCSTSRKQLLPRRNAKVKLKRTIAVLSVLLAVSLVGLSVGQRWRRGRMPDPANVHDRGGIPVWELETEFKEDVFTFVRIRYNDLRGGWKWRTDYLDSDVNFSYRLQELTSLEVDPNGKILELTDPDLFNYPFIYLIEPGDIILMDDEVTALRRYLLNGGFLMVDDFWGEAEWYQFYSQIKRVFPDREPEELPLEHELFHCVYDLKEKPQIPSIGHAMHGLTTERHDAPEAHYRALFDDKGRMMAIICHNTDLGDGWEREGVNEFYFKEFSEKRAYPMGINIVVYAMTH